MLIYITVLIAICYAGYKLIISLPCGKEEPATADEMEWFYG